MQLSKLIEFSTIKWLIQNNSQEANILHIEYVYGDDTLIKYKAHQLLLIDDVFWLEKQLKNGAFFETITALDDVIIGLSEKFLPDSYQLFLNYKNLSVFQFKSPVRLAHVAIKLSKIIQEEQIQELNMALRNTSDLANNIALNIKQSQIVNTAGRIIKHPLLLLNDHFEVIASTPEIKNSVLNITKALKNNSHIDYTKLVSNAQYTYENQIINIYPLVGANIDEKSFLGIFSFEQNDNLNTLLLAQILAMLSITNSKNNLRLANISEQQNKIYSSIIKEELTANQILTQLQLLNISQTNTYQLGLFEIPILNLRLKAKILEKAYQKIKWFTEEYHSPAILIKHENRILIVVPSTQNISHLLIAVKIFLDQSALSAYLFYFGYSKTAATFGELHKIYREALEAARLGIAKQQRITQYRPKYDKEVLKLIPEWETQSYLNELFANIKNQHDVDDLILTLNVYFTHSQSITKVSETMFIHRNTVIFRLKKIESLLEVDLKDAVDVEKLFLGTMLWKLTLDK